MITIAIITLLIVANPKIALLVSMLIGVYFIIFYIARETINKIGIDRLKNNELRSMALVKPLVQLKKSK